MTLAIGDPAPDFTLKDQHGQDVTLSTQARGKVALVV
ncbi:MAG: Peroxiredoxin, partial [Marmoricola sp.]|nr:Peroxiredoxin [Marmoricola sp.]